MNHWQSPFLSSHTSPGPLKQVLHYIRSWGEELRAKKKIIHLDVRSQRAQTHYKYGKQYYFRMSDMVIDLTVTAISMIQQ